MNRSNPICQAQNKRIMEHLSNPLPQRQSTIEKKKKKQDKKDPDGFIPATRLFAIELPSHKLMEI